MSKGQWLTKVRHNGGGESVIELFDDQATAVALAEDFNTSYQSDNYYAEAWDAEKAAAWPDFDRLSRQMRYRISGDPK